MVGLDNPPLVPAKIVTAINGRLIVLPVRENGENKSDR